MLVFKYRIIGLCLSCVLLLVLGLSGSGIAFADSTTGTVNVSAGTLTETNATTPTVSATLNGTDQTTPYTLVITTTDATGSGNGWNLTITSTTFTTTAPVHTLATTASSLTGVTSACVVSTTCTNPTNAITYPVVVPAAGTAPTAVKFFDAAANTGIGKFTITPTVSIAIPASTFAGSYTSTITLAVVSGP